MNDDTFYHVIRWNVPFFGQVGGELFVERCDETKWYAFRAHCCR